MRPRQGFLTGGAAPPHAHCVLAQLLQNAENIVFIIGHINQKLIAINGGGAKQDGTGIGKIFILIQENC